MDRSWKPVIMELFILSIAPFFQPLYCKVGQKWKGEEDWRKNFVSTSQLRNIQTAWEYESEMLFIFIWF